MGGRAPRARGQLNSDRRCSFCGKSQKQVKTLISGPKGVAICDECVRLAVEIIEEKGHFPI